MTRYILKPAVNMHDCNLCSKEFKNSRSLASHKYKFHARSNLKRNFDDGSYDEIHPAKSRKVDKQKSRSMSRRSKSKYQRDESSYEDSSSESSSETEEMPGKHIVTRNKEDIMNSTKSIQRSEAIINGYKSTKYETDDTEESDQESILDDAHHENTKHRSNKLGGKISSKSLTPNKSKTNNIYSYLEPKKDLKKHTKLVKTICKCILDGRIPLEPPHIAKIKPHREVIRNVAHDNINVAKKHIQTGGSILQTVLETVLSILSELLLWSVDIFI